MGKYVTDWTKYKNFDSWEFKCPCCGSLGNGIAESLVDNLQNIRNKYGKSMIISSAYRCPAYNKKVGGITNSKHTTGQAADFYFSDGSMANQNYRIQITNYIKGLPNYAYTYCNINGNYPNMGSAIHCDFNFKANTPQYIQINTTLGVWCRLNGAGFSYPKYKVIPYQTKCQLLAKNCTSANGYFWDKVMYEGKTVYLPNKWNKYC